MYAEDVWGNRIYGDNTVYYKTTSKSVAPGITTYCDYITLPDRSRIDTVYVGIKKVIFSDGTVHENSSIDYWHWKIS